MDKHIASILEEPEETDDCTETVDFHSTPSNSQSGSQLLLTTPDLVKNVLRTLGEDMRQPEKSRLAFDRVTEMHSINVDFLNGCLVEPGRFPSVSAEKSWGNFHKECKINISQISSDTQLSRSEAFHFCMKVFQRLIDINYSHEESQAPNQTITDILNNTEREILHYIGGSIVHSLKQKYLRANNVQTPALLDTLECMLATEGPADISSSKTLTELLDRGGLSYIKDSVVDFLEMLELNFRSKLACSQCTSGTFVKDCIANRVLVTTFQKISYNALVDEEVKESVLKGFLLLFFRIRIHNKCKFFMDDYRNKQHLAKKQKSLRKKLKKNEGNGRE